MYDGRKLFAQGGYMVKEILKDLMLAGIVIVAQIAMNLINGKENDWLFIVLIGVAVGCLDFFITFLKDRLKDWVSPVQRLTEKYKKNNKNNNSNNKKKKKK